jgi:hypothetical protein
MSDTIGNIHDTDITKVKIQVKNLVKDLENGHLAGLNLHFQQFISISPEVFWTRTLINGPLKKL